MGQLMQMVSESQMRGNTNPTEAEECEMSTEIVGSSIVADTGMYGKTWVVRELAMENGEK